ncbi:MAG: CoA-binding protein [Spirochaetia bacterium]|nr:CoA-binding protein [Spirochaetia bacterium]
MTFNLVEYLKTKPVIAVIGATNDSRKFGNIIMKDLGRKGYTAIPINPRATAVEGIPAFPDLKTAKSEHPISLLVYVVPPAITLKSLEEARDLNLKNVWVQPGAGDETVRQFLEKENFSFLINACVMVEAL